MKLYIVIFIIILNILGIISFIYNIGFFLHNKKNPILYNKYNYLTFIDEYDYLICVGRHTYHKEKIVMFEIDKNKLEKKKLRLFINDKLSDKIYTSIVHNFTMSKVGENKYIANAGRDPFSDIKYYEKGHDGGMYFFEGYRKGDAFYFYEKHLGITIDTGAPQTHPASNENFSPIIKDKDKYLIYSRYNMAKCRRFVQIFESKDGINNWKLYEVLKLKDINDNLLKNYSIYLMTVTKLKNKYISLLRYSDNIDPNTYDTSYKLYYAISDDGITFKLKHIVKNNDYWPCHGYMFNNNKINLFFNNVFGQIGKIIVDDNFNIEIVDNILKL